MPGEGEPQRVGISEAAMCRDLLWRLIALLEASPRGAHTRLFDEACRRRPDLAAKQPCEVAWAQIHALGKVRHAMVERRVRRYPALQLLQRGLTFDRELLYAGAMFHDIGLMPSHSSKDESFEVDGAHAARDFLRSHGIPEQDAYTVWTAIALHTTPGVPVHMHPVVALVTAGVEMDVLGLTFDLYSDAEREAVVSAFPRTPHFKEDIIRAFYDGIKHKPNTTFGNVKADVITDKEPHFHRGNFCSVIRRSHWNG